MLSTSSRGCSPAPISSSVSSTARFIAIACSSPAEASSTCSSRSARRSPRASRAKASTSWWGSLRMKPTVSVSRCARPPILTVLRGRVEGVEQPVAHTDLRPRQRVEQRRLAGVGVADEGDRRQRGALALGALTARVPLTCSRRRRSAAMRLRARRRSVSIWVSPGPLVPMPPPSRSRWLHRPRMRARLYSSWASSTWSLPSALPAWRAKMSRITVVRSTTGRPERLLEVALLARRELVVAGDQVRVAGLRGRLRLRELAGPEVGVRVRAARAAGRISPTTATPAVRSSSPSSARSSPSASAADAEARADAPAARAPIRSSRRSACCARCGSCPFDPSLGPRRTGAGASTASAAERAQPLDRLEQPVVGRRQRDPEPALAGGAVDRRPGRSPRRPRSSTCSQ